MKLFGIAALLGLALITGCKNMGDCCGDKSEKMMSMENVDVCPACPGVQHMKDGKCEGCGHAIADACPKCPGINIKLADGTCSGCGMKCN